MSGLRAGVGRCALAYFGGDTLPLSDWMPHAPALIESKKIVVGGSSRKSRSACARMMRSMLAVQPYSPVTSTQGDSVTRSDMTTFSTLSPRISFMSLESGSKSAQSSSHAFLSSSDSSNLRPSLVTETSFLPPYSPSRCAHSSSLGSTIRSTSYPSPLNLARRGDALSTARSLSPLR